MCCRWECEPLDVAERERIRCPDSHCVAKQSIYEKRWRRHEHERSSWSVSGRVWKRAGRRWRTKMEVQWTRGNLQGSCLRLLLRLYPRFLFNPHLLSWILRFLVQWVFILHCNNWDFAAAATTMQRGPLQLPSPHDLPCLMLVHLVTLPAFPQMVPLPSPPALVAVVPPCSCLQSSAPHIFLFLAFVGNCSVASQCAFFVFIWLAILATFRSPSYENSSCTFLKCVPFFSVAYTSFTRLHSPSRCTFFLVLLDMKWRVHSHSCVCLGAFWIICWLNPSHEAYTSLLIDSRLVAGFPC